MHVGIYITRGLNEGGGRTHGRSTWDGATPQRVPNSGRHLHYTPGNQDDDGEKGLGGEKGLDRDNLGSPVGGESGRGATGDTEVSGLKDAERICEIRCLFGTSHFGSAPRTSPQGDPAEKTGLKV